MRRITTASVDEVPEGGFSPREFEAKFVQFIYNQCPLLGEWLRWLNADPPKR